MINRIPGDTVDGAGVTSEDSDGFVSLHVVNVNLVVLRPRGHKRLVHASETTVDGVKALERKDFHFDLYGYYIQNLLE